MDHFAGKLGGEIIHPVNFCPVYMSVDKGLFFKWMCNSTHAFRPGYNDEACAVQNDAEPADVVELGCAVTCDTQAEFVTIGLFSDSSCTQLASHALVAEMLNYGNDG